MFSLLLVLVLGLEPLSSKHATSQFHVQKLSMPAILFSQSKTLARSDQSRAAYLRPVPNNDNP